MAYLRKIAAREDRIIVFIDELSLSERPCRARIWPPKGQKPVLQYRFSWKQRAVVKKLQSAIGKKLLIVWDRLQAHRSRLVKDYLETQSG